MQIGFNRAARLLEQLEEAGIVGPAKGSEPREVYKNEVLKTESEDKQPKVEE